MELSQVISGAFSMFAVITGIVLAVVVFAMLLPQIIDILFGGE